ncbi:MAG: adenosylcobalamin-dependent ribonucleoside-diphosphate reductase [Sedimenticolaceae bacterium]
MIGAPFETAISGLIWDSRYRYRADGIVRDEKIEDSWRRVAHALAAVEPREQALWEQRFFDLLDGFRFLPGGRILAGAGTGLDVTLFNCFVMGHIDDSMEGIFEALKQGALTMQQGGGVGYDFSTLRPAGSAAWRVGGIASGPVSFMRIWDSMCETLLSTGARRGAMMATLRCDHPDIAAFIAAKRRPGELSNFNLSVLVSDAFVQAVRDDAEWRLVFPVEGLGGSARCSGAEFVDRDWPGYSNIAPCAVLRKMPARELWDQIMRANYEGAEPGVLFIDRINRENNLGFRERITATNPCGEIPLPPYGACNLGSVNLTRFVREPFSVGARLDLDAIQDVCATGVRLLDNVIDLSRFPLKMQQEQARGSRRIGLGITGLADTLIMLGLHYGSDRARQLAAQVMETICHSAYRASIALAGEKGPFPFFDRDACLSMPFIRRLPTDIREGIASGGLRNSHLTAIAPTGTISLLANNVSSGIEPVFDFEYRRQVRGPEGTAAWYQLTDYALRHWRMAYGEQALPDCFVDAHQISPQDHLAMQAELQPFVDNAISKTINVPEDYDFTAFRSIYDQAERLGLKGCTTFRPNPVTGSVLIAGESATASHCCGLDRESD